MKLEIHSERDLDNLPADWIISGTESGLKIVRRFEDIPLLREIGTKKVEYIRDPELPAGSVIALTGDFGNGKSTLALAWARDAHACGHPVFMLDRENPIGVIQARYAQLSMEDGLHFRHWGGWVGEDAPQPAAPNVIEWVRSCVQTPLIIVDSLAAFLGADENDASKMREFMDQDRRLANLGATVLQLHHNGKGDTAKDYRGSSDFKASIDVGFLVPNFSTDGMLDKLTLKCYKSRYGLSGDLIYRYAGGNMMRDDTPSAVSRTNAEKLTELLRQNPGIQTVDFERQAGQLGIARKRVRDFVKDGETEGVVVVTKGPGRSQRYRLVGGE
jgi:hypothetical protein